MIAVVSEMSIRSISTVMPMVLLTQGLGQQRFASIAMDSLKC